MAMSQAQAALYNQVHSQMLTLLTDVNAVVHWGNAATDKSNVASLDKVREKAASLPDKKLIEQHIATLKMLLSPVKELRDALTKAYEEKNVSSKYDSIVDYGKKHPKVVQYGDSVFKLEPNFIKSLHVDGKNIYLHRNAHANVPMEMITKHLQDISRLYPKVRAAFTTPPMQ